MNSKLTQSFLKRVVSYDAKTGLFTRIKQTCNKVKVGDIASFKNESGYIALNVGNKLHLAHRLAWLYVYGELPELQLDHINGSREDNRIANLRVVTHAENQQNRTKARKDNKHSEFIGVGFHSQNGRWRARIQVNKTSKWLGYFETKEAAKDAYLAAKAQIHPFANMEILGGPK